MVVRGLKSHIEEALQLHDKVQGHAYGYLFIFLSLFLLLNEDVFADTLYGAAHRKCAKSPGCVCERGLRCAVGLFP